jgi:hypothetical protein
MWFSSAERQMEAAEIIFRDQAPVRQAHEKAVSIAAKEAEINGQADIGSPEPNYRTAEMSVAYALENLLKGPIIAIQPQLISDKKLDNGTIRTHDLVELCGHACLELSAEEKRVLQTLTEISVWAGRYPVAATFERHARTGRRRDDPNARRSLRYESFL